MTSGYSGTPLWKKLGLRAGMAAAEVNAPPTYTQMLAGAPAADWGLIRQGIQFVHVFSLHRAEVQDILTKVLPIMNRAGMIWLSWPKKSAKVPTDITEDVLREIALPMGLVDIKVCAVDDIWSGLKVVIRKDQR
jgi:hypothetical protein